MRKFTNLNYFARKYRAGSDWRRLNSILVLEAGLADNDAEETESEYSGDVTSWWSRDDSIEILSSVYGNLSLEMPEAKPELEVKRTNNMRWTKDNLCRSFGLTLPKMSSVLTSLSSVGDLGNCENTREDCEDHVENHFESETVDSIEYISLYHDLSDTSESDERTLVMYLTESSSQEEESEYCLSDVLGIWHKLHLSKELVTEEVYR